MQLKAVLLATLFAFSTAQAEEVFSKFPGVFYGDERAPTNEEEKLFTLVKEKADNPSRYFKLGKHRYLVTVDSAYIISGVYWVALDAGVVNKIVGGNSEVVEERRAKNSDHWFLVHSVSMHMGVGSDSYSAIILQKDPQASPIVSPLAGVGYDDNAERGILRYQILDKDGDGIDDIVFRIHEKDLLKSTQKEWEEIYVFRKDGFHKKP